MKNGDAQRNVQKNIIDNLNWSDKNENIYNISSQKTAGIRNIKNK